MSKLSPIKRKNIVLVKPRLDESPRPIAVQDTKINRVKPTIPSHPECLALVVNSSHEMAKEITLQLSLANPACSIMYAPTLQIAGWILKRRKVDLIVSSPLLPDGPVQALESVLESINSQPDIIVVGDMNKNAGNLILKSNYKFVHHRSVTNKVPQVKETKAAPMTEIVENLGADLRNDLNNPLQEIVAMVFVARTGKSPMPTEKALDAIAKAATNMSGIVNSIEQKIKEAVGISNR